MLLRTRGEERGGRRRREGRREEEGGGRRRRERRKEEKRGRRRVTCPSELRMSPPPLTQPFNILCRTHAHMHTQTYGMIKENRLSLFNTLYVFIYLCLLSLYVLFLSLSLFAILFSPPLASSFYRVITGW